MCCASYTVIDSGWLVSDWQATLWAGHREESSVRSLRTQHVTKDSSWLTVQAVTATLLSQVGWLTILAVVGDLHLALLGPQHRLGHQADGLFVRQVTVQEVTGARLLHDVRSGEARHLAEAVVAVDDCTVLHPGIGDQEFPICTQRKTVYAVCVCTAIWPVWPQWLGLASE